MKRTILCGLFLIVITGCAGPKYSGSAIKNVPNVDIVIINDKETRIGFQNTIEEWLTEHNHEYVLATDGSDYDLEKISLEYVGHWSWDLALYLSDAYINAYHKGQKIADVSYKAPNTLNTLKFGSAEERIGYMMDVIFGELTVEEANKAIVPKTGS